MVAGNHLFLGINEVEQQDRTNEHRTGVPPQGAPALLLHAPIRGTEGVHIQNVGGLRADLRLKHQGQTKSVAGELLTALVDPGNANHYLGKLQFGSITPGTVLIQEAAALADIEDDGNGLLVDVGTTTQRGTIDYATGLFDVTFGAGPTEPVTVDYDHTDYTDFVSPQQSITHTAPGGTGTGGTAETFSTSFGRVVPGTVSLADAGTQTFVDDGKGNIVQNDAGNEQKAGTIDYATGEITIDTAAAAIVAGDITGTYNFNPFASLVAAGAAAKLLDTFGNPLPELTAEPFADGVKGESRLGLWGQAAEAGANGTSLITGWVHFGEEPYRVEEAFSGFPPGGVVAISGNPNG